jgi:hypothetical protein
MKSEVRCPMSEVSKPDFDIGLRTADNGLVVEEES